MGTIVIAGLAATLGGTGLKISNFGNFINPILRTVISKKAPRFHTLAQRRTTRAFLDHTHLLWPLTKVANLSERLILSQPTFRLMSPQASVVMLNALMATTTVKRTGRSVARSVTLTL